MTQDLYMNLEGFSPSETTMIQSAIEALGSVGYDPSSLQVLIRAELPPGCRGMTLLADGVVLSGEAFSSQEMLNHVLEEELVHLYQKARDPEATYGRGTARTREQEVDAQRQFPCPEA